MMTTTSSKTATYKGRQYRLLWVGQTKFGRRAKLGFFGGGTEFWVDASTINISATEDRTCGGGHNWHCTCGGNMRCRFCQDED